MQLSLRGSLAKEYLAVANECSPDRIQIFVDELIGSSDDDLEKLIEGDMLIIGRSSERGMYPPEW